MYSLLNVCVCSGAQPRWWTQSGAVARPMRPRAVLIEAPGPVAMELISGLRLMNGFMIGGEYLFLHQYTDTLIVIGRWDLITVTVKIIFKYRLF